MINNYLYLEDIESVISQNLPWNKLKNKTILVTGITGLIGSFLVDVIMTMDRQNALNCKVIGICRNTKRAWELFDAYHDNEYLYIIEHDVNENLEDIILDSIDYCIHLASNTHPLEYALHPISTITTNILGTINLLELVKKNRLCRFVLASSNEIYGENRGDVELFDEDYCGYINSNTLRAGYPESKRCSETLCQAYISENNVDAVIVRLTRSYGPTLKLNDSKALSQFIRNALNGENIVLKSEGNQYFSYTYVADAVSGLLTAMLKGKCGEAYNVAHESGDITLKNLAYIIANYSNTEVVFELPNDTEKKGFSIVTKARLSGDKIKNLGWVPQNNIKNGIEKTLCIIGRK